jgi:hypothetical protein
MNWPAIATITAALVAGFSAWYVQAWRMRREAGDAATRVLSEHRDPLLRAAFDLQSRLYNIVAGYFLTQYWLHGSDAEKAYATNSTLWLIGQYLGRVEILRREVQYLDLGSRSGNRDLQLRLSEISSALASDASWLGKLFITFRSDQRAIGEFMVTEVSGGSENKRADCLGYSDFVAALSRIAATPDAAGGATLSPFEAWATRFATELEELAREPRGGLSQPRLITAQRRLMDLVDLLDPDRMRYPGLDGRGRLPEAPDAPVARPERVASFVWPFGDPWEVVDHWAGDRYVYETNADCRRSYVPKSPARGDAALEISSGYRVEICAWVTERGDLRKPDGSLNVNEWKTVDGSLRSRRARREVNKLLDAFSRPLIVDGAMKPDRLVGWLRAR